MKKFIIVAIVFGLASNSSLAMKPEREEGEQAPAKESENKESYFRRFHSIIVQTNSFFITQVIYICKIWR